jgi:hypothetical protein
MRNINITLPILFHSEVSEQLEDLGLPTDTKDLDTTGVTFYSIDTIYPRIIDDKPYTIIVSSGLEYVCTIPKDELWLKLKNHYENNK